jgi:hypothetical protein
MSFLSRRFANRKAELDEEIQAHLQMDIQNRKDRGESSEHARTAAIREFGNIALIEDVTHETWGWVRLERLGQDLKYAFRQLRRSPVFTATVIATLTLGLGATAAMFTVVDHVLLRPLPYQSSHQLVTINEAGKKGEPAELPSSTSSNGNSVVKHYNSLPSTARPTTSPSSTEIPDRRESWLPR